MQLLLIRVNVYDDICLYYREDGRDSMKFYTDPDYFLELWCLEIAKDTENQMKKHKQRGRRAAVSMLVALVGQSNNRQTHYFICLVSRS